MPENVYHVLFMRVSALKIKSAHNMLSERNIRGTNPPLMQEVIVSSSEKEGGERFIATGIRRAGDGTSRIQA